MNPTLKNPLKVLALTFSLLALGGCEETGDFLSNNNAELQQQLEEAREKYKGSCEKHAAFLNDLVSDELAEAEQTIALVQKNINQMDEPALKAIESAEYGEEVEQIKQIIKKKTDPYRTTVNEYKEKIDDIRKTFYRDSNGTEETQSDTLNTQPLPPSCEESIELAEDVLKKVDDLTDEIRVLALNSFNEGP